MCEALEHRGPDDHGTWNDVEAGVALGHRRLAILDLSPAGHQPMISGCGRYVIVFNGEIYNTTKLRKNLENAGRTFRGHSDTEVMLAAFTEWGVEAALRRFVGMFAFALWDQLEKVIILARDRLGEKPLYYGLVRGVFMFASELKALRAHRLWQAEINRAVLPAYVRYGYIPAPHTIYSGISKLLPGCLLRISARHLRASELPEPAPFWSLQTVVTRGLEHPFCGSDEEAVLHLDGLIRQAVSEQMIADVPLGAFLSGGIDSSTIVALMQTQSSRPVKTFTIGFEETNFNEAECAREVARHLRTDHTELYVSSKDAIEVIPLLPRIYDEPFSDSSQIPTYLVSKLTRRHVTVSLSGDAGDELFGGYTHYQYANKLWRFFGRLPRAIRQRLLRCVSGVSVPAWDRALGWVPRCFPGSKWSGRVGHRLHKLVEILAFDGPEDLYLRLMSIWRAPTSLVRDCSKRPTILRDAGFWSDLPTLWEKMMYWDSVSFLPDDILVKVDRASMAVSLESRIPLLDHRVVEFAWRVPLKMKVRNGQGKWLLRQVLAQYVPRELTDRPKMGFGIPIGEWLRGPLRDWAESLLRFENLKADGYFDVESIQTKWKEHIKGQRHWHYELWNILMFQAWLKEQWRNQ